MHFRIARLSGAAIAVGLLIGCPADNQIETDVCHAIADGVTCNDNNPCTTDDKCGAGSCIGSPVKDRTTCDDGDPCTIDDECVAGVCGGLDVCLRPKPDEDIEGCADQPAGTPCDDGDLCTSGDICSADGQCGGEFVVCPVSAAGCVIGFCDGETGQCVDETVDDGQACEDGDACTTGETCNAGLCGGSTLAPDGTPCDDSDADTLGDTCQSGLCAGQPKPCQGECCDAEDGLMCDDGNGCTQGDICAAGACVGADKTLDCSTLNNACVTGACVPSTGECGPIARPDGVECDDNELCTLADACQAGTCRGVPRNCTELDEACVVGVCDAADGKCKATKRSDGFPCHDGNPCTGHDDCNDGACGGEVDLCGACKGLGTGDACDDGDACTPGAGICVQVAAGLRCDAEPKACSEASEACAVGTCDPVDGACVGISLHNGASCDDGNPCTELDSCATGVCVGKEREMCGATSPDFCETGASNDSISTAIPLAVDSAGVTILGGFDSAGDIDWYAVNVTDGQLVDVTTRAHCNSDVATLITAVRPNGKTTVATGTDGGFAKLIGDRAGGDGTYYIGIAALAITTGNTYFMDIAVNDAQPCADDSECNCSQLECAMGGAAAGTCVPKIPIEVESNDSAAEATQLIVGGVVLSRLGSPSDQDWYRLSLTAGQPISITTRASCDEAPEEAAAATASTIDTEVRLYAPDGTSELALATTDLTGGAAAQLSDFLVPETGLYFARVRGEGGALGAYTITAEVTGCSQAEPCSCIDQTCSAAVEGVCKPKLTAPEPGPGDDPGVELLLGKRLHSEIGVPYDTDIFEITLGEGAYDISTLSFCGSSLDTQMKIVDQDDLTAVLAEDDDSGATLFAAVKGFTIVGSKALRIEVKASGAAVGGYLITVKPSGEAQ